MRTDRKEQEIIVQDQVAQHYENMRYLQAHSRRYHSWWTSEMLKRTTDSGIWLDLGCGTGWNLSVLQRMKYKRKGIGIDISNGMLRYAKEKKFEVLRGDAQVLPFRDGTFNGVLAKGVLHHLPDVEQAVSEISRVLKSGGVAVMVDPNPNLFRKFQKFQKNRESHFSPMHRSIPLTEYKSFISGHLEIVDLHFFGLLAYPLAFPDILPFKLISKLSGRVFETLLRIDKIAARLPIAQWVCWGYMLTGRKR